MSYRPAHTSSACCEFSLEAVAPVLERARRRLWRCLTEAQWPSTEGEKIVIAVNEALSNAVQHAYDPGDVEGRTVRMTVMIEAVAPVSGEEAVRRVRVVVADEGRWRSHPDDIARILDQPLGGFALMRALASRVVVDLHPAGTRVVLVSEPVPLRHPE